MLVSEPYLCGIRDLTGTLLKYFFSQQYKFQVIFVLCNLVGSGNRCVYC